MKDNTLNIWIIVLTWIMLIVNLYIGFNNMHTINEYMDAHNELIQTLPPRVIQIDVNYKLPVDSTLVQVEQASKVQQ